jgi:hypothetical protein
MFKVLASSLCCFLITSAAFASDIIEVTVYHDGELNPTTGKTWLGLFPAKGGQFELREAKVTVSLVNDPIADNSPKEKTGRKVTVAGMAEPLVVVTGVSALKPGKVITSTVNKKERFDVGEKLKLNVGTKESTLAVSGLKKSAEWRIGYKIVLECGGIKQTIYDRKQVADSSFPSLLWAGDLDGDKKIDLIMDTTDNYNVRILTLFLSSKAKPGKLVEQVAAHISTGC